MCTPFSKASLAGLKPVTVVVIHDCVVIIHGKFYSMINVIRMSTILFYSKGALCQQGCDFFEKRPDITCDSRY